MNKKMKKVEAFTIMEVVVVVILLGVIASFAIPIFSSARSSDRSGADCSRRS